MKVGVASRLFTLGAVFTAFTVMPRLAVPLDQAVLPPMLMLWMPVLPFQVSSAARSVSAPGSAKWLLKLAAGTKRICWLVLVRLSTTAVLLSMPVGTSVHTVPSSVYCQTPWPLLAALPTMASAFCAPTALPPPAMAL